MSEPEEEPYIRRRMVGMSGKEGQETKKTELVKEPETLKILTRLAVTVESAQNGTCKSLASSRTRAAKAGSL